jgi:hypothetical protein
MSNLESAPAVSAASGFYLTFVKKADKGHAALSAAMSCIAGSVQSGTKKIQLISKATI